MDSSNRFKMLPIVMLITVALLGGIFSTNTSLKSQTETSTSIEGGFANVQVFQDDNHIVMTVTKAGAEVPAEEPGTPIVVNDTETGEGVVVVPTNDTSGEEPAPSEDVVIIEPNGNVTEVPGNVTNIDNSTVIIAPENQTVTETPGDVIVIDPPVCGCPTDEAPAIEEEPAATTNETETTPTTTMPPITIEPFPNDTADNGSEGNDTGAAGFLGWLESLVQ